MKLGNVTKRYIREENGFTLPEMMVTIVIMIVVLLALYSIFDMGLRVFAIGNDKVEAIENARVAVERMERELRAAYPVDKANNKNQIFIKSKTDTAATLALSANSITFGNELGTGNRIVDAPSEVINYSISGGNLVRTEGNGTAQPLVALGPTGSLNLTYWQADGTTAATSESQVQTVRITLTVDEGAAGDSRTQTLTTDVDLRNRGG